MRYEYIRLKFDMGDLDQINQFAGEGWRVISVVDSYMNDVEDFDYYALMERPLDPIVQWSPTAGDRPEHT